MMTPRLFALAPLLFLAAASGCATEQKMVKTSRYTLSYPDYWKVNAVAQKDGEPTKVTVGKFSETVMSTGEGATAASQYEAQQADVDVRIYAWPAPAEAGDPTMQAAQLMVSDPDLKMDKQGRMPEQRDECGREFKRKFSMFGKEHDTLDLASRPGHRLIVVGGQEQGSLIGVMTRVPYEQDTGLYCHNLSNMKLQLQNVLDGLKPVSPAAAPPAAPPATSQAPPVGQAH
jgi:hypothetical protein